MDAQDVLVVHPVALNCANLAGKYLPALGVGLEAEVLSVRVEQVFQYDAGITGVGPLDHSAVAPKNEFPQFLA
jgi:hypothetical protein